MPDVQPGIYEHYKGKRYEVIGLAIHSETREELVVYRTLYAVPELPPNILFVRPKKMFLENVLMDDKEVPRFKFIA